MDDSLCSPCHIAFCSLNAAMDDELKRIRELFPLQFGHSETLLQVIDLFFDKVDKHSASDGDRLTYSDLACTKFPETAGTEEDTIDKVLPLYDFTYDISNPHLQLNVVPCPTTLSVAVDAMTSRCNENGVVDFVGPCAARAEIAGIAMTGDLIGYEAGTFAGIFTFGGSGCNMYACRLGIEKVIPNAKSIGISKTIHMYQSDRAHYSTKTAAMWSGIGTNNLKILPTDERGSMRLDALEQALERTLAEGALIGTIYVTMGTTDSFSLDPLESVIALRDKFQSRVPYKIHVHADAVIGWAYLVYVNAEEAIATLPQRVQENVRSVVSEIKHLHLADSVGIDFHKTGFTSYVCSCVVVKDKNDLSLLNRMREDMPYLPSGDDAYHPGVYTLECSRPNYGIKAVVQMLLFGRRGYQVIIAHMLRVAEAFRCTLKSLERPEMDAIGCTVLNERNPAFVTLFRMYPPKEYLNTDTEIASTSELREIELSDREVNPDFVEFINTYNTLVAAEMKHNFSFTTGYHKTTGDGRRDLVALKSYPMNPRVTVEDMVELGHVLYGCSMKVFKEVSMKTPVPPAVFLRPREKISPSPDEEVELASEC